MAVVDLQAPSPTTAANSVAAYAIYPTPNPSIARMPPTRFVIINYAANGPLNFQFNQNNTGVNPTTGGIMSIGTVIVKQLTSSSLTTNANITWGGQVVDGGGNLQGTVANTAVNGCGSATGCTISVPGPGAVIVYLDSPDSSISNAPNTTGTNGANPDASETSTEVVPAASFDPGYLNVDPTHTLMHGTSTASTIMSNTFNPDGPQQPDSLFLIAFASRLSLQTNGSTSSPRSSFSAAEPSELDDRRYSLFGADDEEEQACQPMLPVWPEELQYAEDSSPAPPASTALPERTHCDISIVAEKGTPQNSPRPKTWIEGAAKKIFVARKSV
ncbi:glycoside hydrolase family 79 protein [Tulasnella calospora MUT 4182]|uniref:Glycoside hydrolase family 79 protein n=1 Tax=Tulasnella calospora MUT 4182 TaxID=1051891 RepID=A0A0C3Q008_9AGAM|nr:glycoside hydrolase family 79 protein [Tulasnella calospora MUT 4182]